MENGVHRQINNVLAGLVIALSLYAMLLPFLPNLQQWIRQRNPANQLRIENQISENIAIDENSGNQLLIPSILVDEPIVIGESLSVIEDGGVWLRPMSVEPEEQGNIILAGHRFTYQQPFGPLYHLDEIKLGDEIGLRWEGRMYTFAVEDIKTVTADSTGIEAPTGDRRLTIYTCTPLLTAEHRLVITAREQS